MEILRSQRSSCEVSKTRLHNIPLAFISALLHRTPTIENAVSHSQYQKSALAVALKSDDFASDADLIRRARNAPVGAFLALDFVVVPHTGRAMQGVDYHYSSTHKKPCLSQVYSSSALVKFKCDPTPLHLDYKVSQALQTSDYPYRTATQSMITTVLHFKNLGINFEGALLDGEFGADDSIEFSQSHGVPVLVRAKRTLSVAFEGQTLTLEELAALFDHTKCHPYAEFGWRAKRLSVSRSGRAFDVLVIWRKVHGVWEVFFLISTFPRCSGMISLLRAWKARWGIEVCHRYFKQSLGLGKCQCLDIQAQKNWAWCVLEAFHEVLQMRRRHPGLRWKHAQSLAAQTVKWCVETAKNRYSLRRHAA